METESNARATLEEERCAVTDKANYEFNVREAKSETTAQNLAQRLHQQVAELYIESEDCEKSRQEQYLLIGVLLNQETALQDNLTYVRNEVKEF